jgi:alkanesulfonate monooxygenase SsuD/methylene tetrahydromethanopterin reductase-like flavin-dependent oxidoreductase (luciferase family)
VKIGLHVPNFGAMGDPRAVADLAARAEGAGWDGFFLWDHVARPEGAFPMLDPWVALAAVAVRTSKLRIGPLVTPLARRRPWNVARQVVTLDQLSGGRATLGVGLGISTGPEFSSFGEESDPKVRGDMLDESLRILRAAWQGAPVTHRGAHYRLDSVAFLPTPVQQPAVPIWGATEHTSGRPVRRAAALDGVFPFGLTPAELPSLLSNLSRLRPGGLSGYDVVAAGTDDWRQWRDAGATWWLRVLPWAAPIEESISIVESGRPAG